MSIGYFIFGNQKIDFHAIFFILPIAVCIKEQLMPRTHQHLCHNIFQHHAHIDFQFINQQFPIYFLRDNPVFIKGMANQ